MKRILFIFTVFALGLLMMSGTGLFSGEKMMEPFGGKKDVMFAQKVWKTMEDYMEWPMKSGVYPGTSPHGVFLRLYYNIINLDGKPYHVIVKDNFGGKDITMDMVKKDPVKYLAAVTIMVQREPGYDPDNNNWFWAKYLKDGSLDKNPKDMKLAGRVAKGMKTGCIACHAKAKDNDYLFANDQ